MRIIDKNTDYYDYLQNSDDPIVFDRRGSYLLTKDRLCEVLVPAYYNSIYTKDRRIQEKHNYKYLLLQCGATFWLILLYDVRYNNYGRPTEYKMELLTTWKDYTRSRGVLVLDDKLTHSPSSIRYSHALVLKLAVKPSSNASMVK